MNRQVWLTALAPLFLYRMLQGSPLRLAPVPDFDFLFPERNVFLPPVAPLHGKPGAYSVVDFGHNPVLPPETTSKSSSQLAEVPLSISDPNADLTTKETSSPDDSSGEGAALRDKENVDQGSPDTSPAIKPPTEGEPLEELPSKKVPDTGVPVEKANILKVSLEEPSPVKEHARFTHDEVFSEDILAAEVSSELHPLHEDPDNKANIDKLSPEESPAAKGSNVGPPTELPSGRGAAIEVPDEKVNLVQKSLHELPVVKESAEGAPFIEVSTEEALHNKANLTEKFRKDSSSKKGSNKEDPITEESPEEISAINLAEEFRKDSSSKKGSNKEDLITEESPEEISAAKVIVERVPGKEFADSNVHRETSFEESSSVIGSADKSPTTEDSSEDVSTSEAAKAIPENTPESENPMEETSEEVHLRKANAEEVSDGDDDDNTRKAPVEEVSDIESSGEDSSSEEESSAEDASVEVSGEAAQDEDVSDEELSEAEIFFGDEPPDRDPIKFVSVEDTPVKVSPSERKTTENNSTGEKLMNEALPTQELSDLESPREENPLVDVPKEEASAIDDENALNEAIPPTEVSIEVAKVKLPVEKSTHKTSSTEVLDEVPDENLLEELPAGKKSSDFSEVMLSEEVLPIEEENFLDPTAVQISVKPAPAKKSLIKRLRQQ